MLKLSFAKDSEFNEAFNGTGHLFASRRTDCEFEALQVGSYLADSLNAPNQSTDLSMRVHQKIFAKHLGFAWWQYNGTVEPADPSLLSVQKSSKWFPIEPHTGSRYEALDNKWLYIMGDSTTRQLWAIFSTLVRGHDFEQEALHFVRSACIPQPHRAHWDGACGANERTCTEKGYGDKGLFSWDWKHFVYEDYDQWLWGPEGPWIQGFEGRGLRRPDVLSIQTGLHAVYHYVANETNVWNADMYRIPLLFEKIRHAIDHPPPPGLGDKWEAPTLVIIVTSGTVYSPGAENAVSAYNRMAVEQAEKFGFAVLDRGEIERRVLVRSLHSSHPIVTRALHFGFPVPHIITTMFLHLYTCLTKHQPIAPKNPLAGDQWLP